MVLEVLCSWMGVGLVGVAISCSTLLCLASYGTASMATAISAGVVTTCFRCGIGMCSFVITMTTALSAGVRGGTMATAVNAGDAIAGVRGGIGLCCCAASVITLVTVAAAKSWNTYIVNDHRPAFLKPLIAFWTGAAFLYATLGISATCHFTTGLPTCSLIHNLNALS